MSDEKLGIISTGPSGPPHRPVRKKVYSASVRYEDAEVLREFVPSLPPRPKQVRERTPYGTFEPLILGMHWPAKIHAVCQAARPPWVHDVNFAGWDDEAWLLYMSSAVAYVAGHFDVVLRLNERWHNRLVELGKALCLPDTGKRVNPSDYLMYQVAWYRHKKKVDAEFMVFSSSPCFPPLQVLLSAKRAQRTYFREMWADLAEKARASVTSVSTMPVHVEAAHVRRLRYHEAHLIDKYPVLRGEERETIRRRLRNLLHFERQNRPDPETTDAHLVRYAQIRMAEVDKGWFGPEHGDQLLSDQFGIPAYRYNSRVPLDEHGYAVIGEERPLLRLGADDRKAIWG